MLCPIFCTNHILVDDLQTVIVDIFLVDQRDVLSRSIVTAQILDMILLYLPGLFHDVFIRVCYGIVEKVLPFRIGKGIMVQFLQLPAEITDQITLRVNRKVFIPLLTQHADEFLFQGGFALVTVGTLLYRLIFRDNGIF